MSSLAALASLALVLTLLPGCSSVTVQSEQPREDVDLEAIDTYAWTESRRRFEGAVDDPGLDQRVRAAVDAELASRGMVRTGDREAQVFLTHALLAQVRAIAPEVASGRDAPDEMEDGTLVLEVFDALGSKLWWGRGTRELRMSGRAMGISSTRYIPTGEPRVWEIEDLVDAILDDFPR